MLSDTSGWAIIPRSRRSIELVPMTLYAPKAMTKVRPGFAYCMVKGMTSKNLTRELARTLPCDNSALIDL